jgi:glycosyltransferase involved in cell wall biosynthesis
MRKVCFVNNYNYDKYLPFCLDSLVRQTVKFDIIYIVDDGSTDRSRSIIAEYAKSFRNIIPLFKDNGGQLSCFNFLCEYLTEDDLVWCIDSDDYYPPDYVERFLIETRNSQSDFFFCKTFQFSTDDTAPKTSYLEDKPIVDIGLSVQMSRLVRCWIGGPTSSIVLSGRLFKNILPYPFENQWKTCADEVLVHASSLGGYSKIFLHSLCFGYRIHGSNYEYGRVFNREHIKNRINNRDILFSWYSTKFGFEEKIKFASILNEYNSISPSKYRKTFSISLSRLLKKHLIRKVCFLLKM